MKQLYAFLLLGFSMLIFTACQKSYTIPGYTYTPPTTGGGTSGGGSSSGGSSTGVYLSKTVTLDGTDTFGVNIFTYDANNKVVNYYIYSKSNSIATVANYSIARNSSGSINQFTVKTAAGSTSQPDVVHNLYYSSNSANCDYAISRQDFGGGLYNRDSIVYSYSGNNIIKSVDYNQIEGLTPYTKTYIYTYNYDANNNLIYASLSLDASLTGGVSSLTELNFQFDNMNNAEVNFGNDLIYLTALGGKAKNNAINYLGKATSGTSITTTTTTYNYTYNSAGYPTSVVQTNGGSVPVSPVTLKTNFYYK